MFGDCGVVEFFGYEVEYFLFVWSEGLYGVVGVMVVYEL